MLLDAAESQLVLVDYQSRLMPAIHEGPAVLANALRLARIANRLAVPVWGTEQNPTRLGPNDEALRELCQRTLSKMQFGGADEGLADQLRSAPGGPDGGAAVVSSGRATSADEGSDRTSIVIAGCEAHVCLLQTALQLLERDFEVWVVSDACGSRTERNRDAGFDRLVGAGATLVTTEMVAFEWLRSCEHPAFKDVLALIK